MSLDCTLMFSLFLKINTCHKWININNLKSKTISGFSTGFPFSLASTHSAAHIKCTKLHA